MDKKRILFATLIGKGLLSLAIVAVILFLSAGNIFFREAWIFISVFAFAAFSFGVWLYVSHPEQFLNRFRTEKNPTLQRITNLIAILACLALVIAGLDKRFEWSYRSDLRFIFAGLLLAFATLVYRDVFIHNPFLSNAIEIHESHEVIQQGMYSIVRHPMYLATICACAAGLIILGSWINVLVYLAFVVLVITRIKHEEKMLLEALPDYTEYSKKVKYKLLPYLW